MAHVGVKRLAPRYRQDDRPQRHEAFTRVTDQESQGVKRIERNQYRGCLPDVDQTQECQDAKPGGHDRAEEFADRARAMALNPEKAGEYQGANRKDILLELRGNDFQPLYRAQHRNGGGDHAVSVKQGGGEDTQHGHDPGGSGVSGQFRDPGEQGQATPFPVIVGAHDDGYILEGHQGHDGPED